MSCCYIYIIPFVGRLKRITQYGDISNAHHGSYMILHQYINPKYSIPSDTLVNRKEELKIDRMYNTLYKNKRIAFNDRVLIGFSHEMYVKYANISRLIAVLQDFCEKTELTGNIPDHIRYLQKVLRMRNVYGVCFAIHDDNDDNYHVERNELKPYIRKQSIWRTRKELFAYIDAHTQNDISMSREEEIL